MTVDAIIREPLLKATLDNRSLNAVDVRRITFQPGQQTGRHRHPCPVVGYVIEGCAVLQIEGEAAQELPAGSAFYEPADTVIAGFDNLSSSNRMIFVAFYLLHGEQDLIQMLADTNS